MEINDIILENQQLDELTAGQVGTAVGKGVDSVAGAGKAFLKGFRGGKSTSQLDDIKKQIAKLSSAERKELITHITALNKPSAQTAPASTGSGLTNVLKKGASAAGATVKKGAAAISKPPQTPAAGARTTPTAVNKNVAAGGTYEKAKGDIRKVQSGTKPIPPNAAADIQGAIAKLAKGDKESGVFAAQKIMNLARAGVDVSKQQQAWVANAKAGERFLTQSVYFEITKMLREHNLSWNDLGIRVHLLENTNKLVGISVK